MGEAIHILDLKPLRQSGVQLGGQLEISAWFAEGKTPPATRYHWTIKAAAFKGEVAAAPELWKVWDQASLSFVGREICPEPGGHWQQMMFSSKRQKMLTSLSLNAPWCSENLRLPVLPSSLHITLMTFKCGCSRHGTTANRRKASKMGGTICSPVGSRGAAR